MNGWQCKACCWKGSNSSTQLSQSPFFNQWWISPVSNVPTKDEGEQLESSRVKEAALDDKLGIELRSIVEQIQVPFCENNRRRFWFEIKSSAHPMTHSVAKISFQDNFGCNIFQYLILTSIYYFDYVILFWRQNINYINCKCEADCVQDMQREVADALKDGGDV